MCISQKEKLRVMFSINCLQLQMVLINSPSQTVGLVQWLEQQTEFDKTKVPV